MQGDQPIADTAEPKIDVEDRVVIADGSCSCSSWQTGPSEHARRKPTMRNSSNFHDCLLIRPVCFSSPNSIKHLSLQPSRLTFRSKRFHLAALRSRAHLNGKADQALWVWLVRMIDRFGVHPRPGSLPTTRSPIADPIRSTLRLELLIAHQTSPRLHRHKQKTNDSNQHIFAKSNQHPRISIGNE